MFIAWMYKFLKFDKKKWLKKKYSIFPRQSQVQLLFSNTTHVMLGKKTADTAPTFL